MLLWFTGLSRTDIQSSVLSVNAPYATMQAYMYSGNVCKQFRVAFILVNEKVKLLTKQPCLQNVLGSSIGSPHLNITALISRALPAANFEKVIGRYKKYNQTTCFRMSTVVKVFDLMRAVIQFYYSEGFLESAQLYNIAWQRPDVSNHSSEASTDGQEFYIVPNTKWWYIII